MARRAPDPASVAAAAPPTTVEPQPAASAAAAALAPSPSVRDSLDVEHYVPRVPLQLVAVAFALAAPALAPRAAVVPRPAEVLAVYVRDPVQSLSVAAALVAVVQVWFGYWARSCRAGAAHLRRQDAQRSAATRRLERSRTAARRTAPHGFRAVLGHIWNNPVGEWATPEGEAAVAGQPTLVGGIDYSVSPPHFSRLFFWGGGARRVPTPGTDPSNLRPVVPPVRPRGGPRHPPRDPRVPRVGSPARRPGLRVRASPAAGPPRIPA